MKSKSAILEEIIKIIENDCEKIEIVKEKTSESDRKEGKITTFLNAQKMLYAAEPNSPEIWSSFILIE